MGRACCSNGDKRSGCRIFVGKQEGKRSLGRPRRRWVYNITMDLGEIVGVLWTGSMWLRIEISGGFL
jgi:hypothetical protein